MANVIGKRVRGNLVYIDRAGHLKRVIDAIGPDVIKHIWPLTDKRLAAADAPLGWTVTLVEAGAGESTITAPDGINGALLLTTDANEDDGVQMQLTGESFEFTSDQPLVYFYAKLKLSDATQSDFLIGLCITDTSLLGGMTDGVYFRKVDGTTALSAVTEKDSTETETETVHTMADATDVELEFYFDGTAVEFFVNGVSMARHTANIVDDELLTPSIALLAGAAAAKTLTLAQEIRWIQVGR